MEVIEVMNDDIEIYGILKKEVIDKLEVDIDDILNGSVNDEDEKLDVLKQISNLKIRLDGILKKIKHSINRNLKKN